MFRFKVPDILPTLFPDLTWRVNTSEPVLYLTFDDGPDPEVTPFVMEILQQYQAKGTFFCVGENVERHPETYTQLQQNGHQIANHTFNHLNGWRTPTPVYLENVAACAKVVHSPLFRPPYGRISRQQIKALKSDYRIVMWDMLTCDYDPGLNVNRSLKAMQQKSRPGSIMVFHDSAKAAKNLKILLPGVLDYFSDKGYRFDALYA